MDDRHVHLLENILSDMGMEEDRPVRLMRGLILISEIKQFLEMLQSEPVYRIFINTDNSVLVDCYDLMENFKPELKRHYDSLDELPKWVQDKLAVLMLLDPDNINNDVEKVGRRISDKVFWVYRNGEISG